MALNSYQQIEISMVFGFKLNALLLYYANNISRQYLNIFRKDRKGNNVWIMSKKIFKLGSKKIKHCKMCTNAAIVNNERIIFEKKNKIKNQRKTWKSKTSEWYERVICFGEKNYTQLRLLFKLIFPILFKLSKKCM